MNEQNYENNYETQMETEVEFEPMIVQEVKPDHNDMVIGVGIGAAAAITIEHLIIPAARWTYRKVKKIRKPKFHKIEGEDEGIVVDESDIEC